MQHNQPYNKCFRCGEVVHKFEDCGQVTIAGFYSNQIPFPYYNSFTLCETCHKGLTETVDQYLYKEDENGE